MKISFAEPILPREGILVVGVYFGKTFTPQTEEVNTLMGGGLQRALDASLFKGKKEESLSILAPHGLEMSQVLIIGLGRSSELSALALEEIGGRITASLSNSRDKEAYVYMSQIEAQNINSEQAIAYMASGALLRSWRFDEYQTKKKKEEKQNLKSLTFACEDIKIAKEAFDPLEKIAEGVFITREVVSQPPNVLYPESLAKIAQELSSIGVKVEVLGEEAMQKLGMNALLGVGQGSIRESQLVVLQWNGGSKDQAPIAIVGKGVTFDTGGISIKPAGNMDEMKYDMAGSGVVLGLMKSLALRKANVNVVGIMGLTENMPSGSAQRPGDIVTSMSGQTIEILNTDAEGRLVLGDALWYTQDRFKPQLMIDLATLTGAITVALGSEYAGLFSNNDALSKKLTKSSEVTGEKLWRFPLGKAYDRDIDSDVADMKNIGSGRGAGSITAAQFLQRFVNDVPWAHLDIAGVAWEKKDRPLMAKGATAFGVRLLNHFLQQNYEG